MQPKKADVLQINSKSNFNKYFELYFASFLTGCNTKVSSTLKHGQWTRIIFVQLSSNSNETPLFLPCIDLLQRLFPLDVSEGSTGVSFLLNNQMTGGEGSLQSCSVCDKPASCNQYASDCLCSKVFEFQNSQIDLRENCWHCKSLASRT
jgi:hypothetical protein